MRTFTLVSLLPGSHKCPAFIKVDIEGMEGELLLGGAEMLARCMRKLLLLLIVICFVCESYLLLLRGDTVVFGFSC